MNRAAGGLSHCWQQGGRFARAAAFFQEAPQPAAAIVAERPVLRPALGQVAGRGRRRPQCGLRLRVPPCGPVRLGHAKPCGGRESPAGADAGKFLTSPVLDALEC